MTRGENRISPFPHIYPFSIGQRRKEEREEEGVHCVYDDDGEKIPPLACAGQIHFCTSLFAGFATRARVQ